MKKFAQNRIQQIREWHQQTFERLRTFPKDVQGSILDAFSGGFMINYNKQHLREYGLVYKIDVYTARLLLDILRVMEDIPRLPCSLTVHRALVTRNAPEAAPHALPLATSLRGGFTYHWLNKQQAHCCSLRIQLHKGAKALFWGPPPFPTEEDVQRMKAIDPYYREQQYEVLLPPCVLRKRGATSRKDMRATQLYVPEYFAHLPVEKTKTKSRKVATKPPHRL